MSPGVEGALSGKRGREWYQYKIIEMEATVRHQTVKSEQDWRNSNVPRGTLGKLYSTS
jgi:hypothetical protein